MKKKINLFTLLCATFMALNTKAGDAYISYLSIGKYIETNASTDVELHIKNASGSNISSLTFSWQLDNGPIQTDNSLIGGGGLSSGNTYLPLTHDDPLVVSADGNHTFKIWVTAAGDTNPANDTITVDMVALSTYAEKTVLFEEYTADWCQYCAEANSIALEMSMHPNIVVAAFHNSDPMSFTEGETYFEAYYPASIFTPGGVLELGQGGNYEVNSARSTWEDASMAITETISPVEFMLDVDFNNSSRQLTTDITVNFKHAETKDYYINAYVVENRIPGSQSGAPPGYIHHHVVRAMLGGIDGTAGVIPNTPAVNTDYTHQYTYTLPAGWNADNIAVVAYVFEKDGDKKQALNAAEYSFTPLSISDNKLSVGSLEVYPNPFSDVINVSYQATQPGMNAMIKIYSIDGKVAYEQALQLYQTGVNNITIEEAGLSPGLYHLVLQTEDGTIGKRILRVD